MEYAKMTELSGFFGIILLLIDLWAIYRVFKSSAGLVSKIIWTLIIFFLPLLGLLIWWFFGPK